MKVSSTQTFGHDLHLKKFRNPKWSVVARKIQRTSTRTQIAICYKNQNPKESIFMSDSQTTQCKATSLSQQNQINELKLRWASDSRWKNLVRNYTPESVLKLRGS